LKKLKLKQPENGIARSAEEAFAIAEDIGFPLVIRPSYVLGGQAMRVVHTTEELEEYINTAVRVSGDTPVLLDRYLRGAIEIDADTVSDGKDVSRAIQPVCCRRTPCPIKPCARLSVRV